MAQIKRKIDKIIIHCSATSNDNSKIRAADIDRWHKKDNGWKMIGYHYVICRDGIIETGRPLDMIGAHCKGQNKTSIGICLVGLNRYTPEQYKSLFDLLYSLMVDCKLSDKQIIYGHYQFEPNKTCPNLVIEELRDELTAAPRTHLCLKRLTPKKLI